MSVRCGMLAVFVNANIQKLISTKRILRWTSTYYLFREGAKEVTKLIRGWLASLQTALGEEYHINYPELKSDGSAPDFGWVRQIGGKISETTGDIILVGHSLGASLILKYLSENSAAREITGIFLVATPFWNGNEDWQRGLKLQENFAEKLPRYAPLFFYHCQDDEEVPFSSLDHYKQNINWAVFREIKQGGHQLNNQLTLVANDIKSI